MTRWLALALVLVATRAAAQVKLTIWDEEQPDIQTALDEVIAAFQSAHPKLQVQRAHYKTEDLRVQFATATIGGGGPDLLLAPNDFAGVFSTMGTIQPVQSWAEMPRFHPDTVKAITDAKGNSFGVPLNRGNHLLLYVNKAMMTPPPKTLEELVASGKRITDAAKRRYGLAYNALEPFWFVPFVGAFGTQTLVDGKPNLATPATEKALRLVRALARDDGIMPESCDYACAETLFVERKAATTINGDWAIRHYAEMLGKDLAIMPLPTLVATGKAMTPMISGKYLMLNAKLTGDRLAAARTFVAYMTSEDVQLKLALRTKRLPSLAALTTNPKVKADPLLAASEAGTANAVPMPMAVEMRAVWDAIRPQLQAVVVGRQEPAAAPKIMQADAVRKVGEMKF